MEKKPSPTLPESLYMLTQEALGDPATLPFSRIGVEEGIGSMYLRYRGGRGVLLIESKHPAASKFELLHVGIPHQH